MEPSWIQYNGSFARKLNLLYERGKWIVYFLALPKVFLFDITNELNDRGFNSSLDI